MWGKNFIYYIERKSLKAKYVFSSIKKKEILNFWNVSLFQKAKEKQE
jgi:hypothetical protein